MKRLHLALGVADIPASIIEYTNRLGKKPLVIIENEYALYRTDTLNVSIRKVSSPDVGLRHLGWESPDYTSFEEEIDCNGITWEFFPKEDQVKEILENWPDAKKDNVYLQWTNGTYY